jgi:hypothetical protein
LCIDLYLHRRNGFGDGRIKRFGAGDRNGFLKFAKLPIDKIVNLCYDQERSKRVGQSSQQGAIIKRRERIKKNIQSNWRCKDTIPTKGLESTDIVESGQARRIRAIHARQGTQVR